MSTAPHEPELLVDLRRDRTAARAGAGRATRGARPPDSPPPSPAATRPSSWAAMPIAAVNGAIRAATNNQLSMTPATRRASAPTWATAIGIHTAGRSARGRSCWRMSLTAPFGFLPRATPAAPGSRALIFTNRGATAARAGSAPLSIAPANSAPPTVAMPPTTASTNTGRPPTSSKSDGADRLGLHPVEGAADAGDRRRGGEHRDLRAQDRAAERGARRLAVLDGQQPAAGPAPPHGDDDERQQGEHDRAENRLGARAVDSSCAEQVRRRHLHRALAEEAARRTPRRREVGQGEDPPVEDHGERRGAQRQVDARQAQRRQRDERRPRRRR